MNLHTCTTDIPRFRSASDAARVQMLAEFGEPFLLADWVDVLMMHLEVDRAALQRVTPFPLDLFEGRAFVSLVAFTMRRMRPRWGGRLGAWLFQPIATHPFLNVRTYVRHRDETGIHFLTEWVPNPWSLRLGPRSFGLPYRLAKLDYRQAFDGEPRDFSGTVIDASGASFIYEGRQPPHHYAPCVEGSLEAWLMERYIAFTHHRGISRYFRVWHPPWQRTLVDVTIQKQSLLNQNWPWLAAAEMVSASGSPGFEDIWMGRPR
jgi:uncharacterized protein YqjF (DUF2071 family)